MQLLANLKHFKIIFVKILQFLFFKDFVYFYVYVFFLPVCMYVYMYVNRVYA